MAKIEVFSGIEKSATILVVDDEEPIRKMVETFLHGSGYTVLHAASGDAALTICEGASDAIQLLISDVVMPGMSGFDLAERVEERWPDIKILLISGCTGDVDIHRRLRDRPLLQKPFTPDELTSKVRDLLSQAVAEA